MNLPAISESVGTRSTDANPMPIDMQETVLSQESQSKSPAIDQAGVKILKALAPGAQEIRVANPYERCVARALPSGWGLRPPIIICIVSTALGLGWLAGFNCYFLPDLRREEPSGGTVIDAVVERVVGGAAIAAVVGQIIGVESDGDPNLKNKRSSATGLGQFLNETWLDLIRAHRPDLAKGRSDDEILELRRDAKVAGEITTRFTERNAAMLRRRGLPVTPGTLYLAHFAGGAGAVAVLSALDNADAALVMANADATGRTKRDKIVKANPFLERFTVADLKGWADRKMRLPGFHATAPGIGPRSSAATSL
jgi:hypothetical protein